MSTSIPNFNDFGCLIDRMSVEAVKESQFEDRGEERKVKLQKAIRKELKQRFIDFCLKTYIDKKYNYYGEERTFG